MPHVGDVLHVADLIPRVAEIADDHIERNVGFGMADMRAGVDGRPADIDVNPPFGDGLEGFEFANQAVVHG